MTCRLTTLLSIVEFRWSDRVHDSRETELKWRVKDNIVSVLITFIWTWIPSATAVSSFLCYTLVAGERLTVAKAFTSIALFSYLQEPMTQLPGQFFALLRGTCMPSAYPSQVAADVGVAGQPTSACSA